MSCFQVNGKASRSKSAAEGKLESRSSFVTLIPQDHVIFLIVGEKQGCSYIKISQSTKAQASLLEQLMETQCMVGLSFPRYGPRG